MRNNKESIHSKAFIDGIILNNGKEEIVYDSNENKTVSVRLGDGFMQGIFVQYGITFDDNVNEIRNGGFGSTTK